MPVLATVAVVALANPGAGAPDPGSSTPRSANHSLHYEHGDGRPLDFEEVCQRVRPAVCVFRYSREETRKSVMGSGVLVHPSGVLLTCFHVISGGFDRSFLIDDAQGRALTLDGVLGFDIGADWAALKVHYESAPGAQLPCVKLGDPHRLRLESRIIALGNPMGLTLTCSEGRVEHLGRESDRNAVPLIQHDALTAPGSSGGGVFTFDGALVGLDAASVGAPWREQDSRYCLAVPLDRIHLPDDTTCVLPQEDMRSFLRAYEMAHGDAQDEDDLVVDAADKWTDWSRVQELLAPFSARLERFPEAALLAARAALDMKQPDSSTALCQSVLASRSGDPRALLLMGAARLRQGDSTGARETWRRLRDADSLEVRWAVTGSRLFGAERWMPGYMVTIEDSLAAWALPDSAPQWPLSQESADARVYKQFGVRGLKVYTAINREEDSTDVCEKYGVTMNYVRRLMAMADAGDRSGVDGTAEDSTELDTTTICSGLRDFYRMVEERPSGWARAVLLIREALRWPADAEQRAVALTDLGEAYYMLDELGAADSVLTEAIETAPEAVARPFELRAIVRLLEGQYARASHDVVRAREILVAVATDSCDRPCREAGIRLQVVEACALMRQGRVKDAQRALNQVIEQDPQWNDGPPQFSGCPESARVRRLLREMWQRSGRPTRPAHGTGSG